MLDIDDTDDPVHGQQELALFNAHYDCTCFQPIHIFDGLSGKPVLSLLRPGKRPSGEEVAKVLRHVIRRIRKHWPKVEILVRGDSHYCSEPALALLEAMRCDYIIGFAINSKLLGDRGALARPLRHAALEDEADGAPLPSTALIEAREWSRSRKLVARVEATPMGTDVRFIVTNLEGRGKTLYEKVFCARGAAENLIKDMKRWTRSDKTACSRWQANQFRLFLHMGAYWLLHALAARGTEALALARSHLRDDPAHVREDRRACRGAEGQDQARLPGQLPSGRHARGDDGRDHDAGPMIDAARAARALLFNHKRVPIAPEAAAVNPADETRLRF